MQRRRDLSGEDFPASAFVDDEVRLGLRHRRNDLIRRYQRSTGRTVSSPGAVATLIAG